MLARLLQPLCARLAARGLAAGTISLTLELEPEMTARFRVIVMSSQFGSAPLPTAARIAKPKLFSDSSGGDIVFASVHCIALDNKAPLEQLRAEGGIMEKDDQISRRSALKAAAAGVTATLALSQELKATSSYKPKGNLNQSVCKWCYKDMALGRPGAGVGSHRNQIG